ncbi:MAG: MarR family winged helix-turn-helix transcriptional regulator [Flavobacteriaceae bacterium]
MKTKTFDYALRATWGAVSKMYNRTAAKFDSTMATGFALLNIDAQGTPSTALGPKMGMEGTSISRLLKSMEDRGLIERKPDPSDGRGVLIYLTEFGREKREFSKQTVLQFNEAISNELPQEKVDHFFEVIERITHYCNNYQEQNHNVNIN